MNKFRTVLVLFLAMLPSLAASDVPVISLSEALEAARENSITLESARITMEMKMRNQDAVMTTFMPDLSLSAGVSTGVSFPGTISAEYGSIDEPLLGGLSVNAGVNASFSFNGSMITDAETRRLEKQDASLTYEGAADDIEEAVTNAYWNIAAQDAAIESAKIAAEDAAVQYESALEMYDSGLADELSVIQLDLAARNAELNVRQLEDSRELMMASLCSLTGLEGDFTTEPLPQMTMLDLPSAEELFGIYGENTVEIRQARNTLALSENAADTARLGTYVPVLTASVGYTYGGSGYQSYKGHSSGYGHNTNGLSGSITMTVPISSMLPGSSASMAIKDADDSVRLSSLALQNAKDELIDTIRECVITIGQAQDNIKMQQKAYESAEQSYQLSLEAYESGLLSADDLSASRNSMLSAEITLLNTKLQHLLSCHSLSFALGTDIDELTEKYAISEENIQ